MEELADDTTMAVISPFFEKLNQFKNDIYTQLQEWDLDFTVSSNRIQIEDITIDFIELYKNSLQGFQYDYVFLLNSQLFSPDFHDILDTQVRPFSVVIG